MGSHLVEQPMTPTLRTLTRWLTLRPLRPPVPSNPYLNAMSGGSLIAGIAFIFDANVIAFVFGILTCICFALTIHHARFNR